MSIRPSSAQDSPISVLSEQIDAPKQLVDETPVSGEGVEEGGGFSEDGEGLRVEHISEDECAFLYQEIFVRESYIRHGITLQDGAGDVLDVGANIGLFSLYTRRRFDRDSDASQRKELSRIFAFEPVPRIHQVLKRNLAGVSGAHVRDFALGAAPVASERFVYFADAPGESSRHVTEALRQRARMRGADTEEAAANSGGRAKRAREGEAKGREELRPKRHHGGAERGEGASEGGEPRGGAAERGVVPAGGAGGVVCHAEVRTLSGVLREEGIGRVQLLKVDAEGDELQVLMGLHAQDWPRIHQVSLEVHDDQFRLARVEALLRRQGFRVFTEPQESEWDQDFLLLVPKALKLFYVYALR